MTSSNNPIVAPVKKPLIIGLTGGIGAGKSAAADWFIQQGITVIDADEIAKQVVTPPSALLDAIADQFGTQALLDDGTLNRAYIRELIFNDAEKRKQLENILHPAIIAQIELDIKNSHSPYSIVMSPLLFETSLHNLSSQTLLIDANTQHQLLRASTRDKVSTEAIAKVVAAQMPIEQKRVLANHIVSNNSTLIDLYKKLEPLHQQYLQLASQF